MSRWQHIWRVAPVFVVLMLVLTGCGDPYLSALQPAGYVADKQLSLIKLSLIIMIFVVSVVAIIYTYVLIRFRKRPGQKGIPEQVEGNTKLEILWTVIPIILLIILAVPTVTTTFSLAEQHSSEEALQIKVVAHQYWWEIEYPDLGIVTAQEIHIPTGKKVQFELTSDDVIHSLWVPPLGGKTDTVPGKINTMWLQADKPGTYHGRCAELCGEAHALMNFEVVAQEPADFDTWVSQMQAAAEAAPEQTDKVAQRGQEIFAQNCIACHAIGGQGTDIGPNLNGFGSRESLAGILENNPDELARWLADPQAVKPGNKMPNLNLNNQDISALVKYLTNLKLNQ